MACAASVSELATEIQAMPATTMAGNATQTSGTVTISADAAACTRVPATTNSLGVRRARQRGKYSAAITAPSPRHDSITVKKPAPPPCRPCATSGSSASSAVLCTKNRNTRSSTSLSRGACSA